MSRFTLVVIDMQPIFGDPSSPWGTQGFDEILPTIAELAKGADKVIATRFVPHDEPPGMWLPYYEIWSEVRSERYVGHFDLVPEVEALAERVVSAPTFSKWEVIAPEIEGTVVLCGVATECCVLSTAIGGIDAGVPIRVIAEACRGATSDLSSAALAVLGSYAPHCEIRLADEAYGE
ncbi:MAG: cysteine hydrolase family protein [Acidimicrobiales bacterium]